VEEERRSIATLRFRYLQEHAFLLVSSDIRKKEVKKKIASAGFEPALLITPGPQLP
jgi:hypothetical protein